MNSDDQNAVPDPLAHDRSEPAPESSELDLPPHEKSFDHLALFESATPQPENATPVEEFTDPVSLNSNVPEDLRVPWGWLDLLLLAVIAVCGAFLLAVLVALGLAAYGISMRQLQNPATMGFLGVVVQVILDLLLLGFLAVQMRVRFHLQFWRAIGWRQLETGKIPRALAYLGLIVGGCLIAVVVTLASAIWPPKGELPIEQFLQDRHTLILFALMAVLIAPLVEETIFRGYLYPVVARSFGVSTGIIATGIVFGLAHAGQLAGGYWQIALLMMVGILFTFARASAKTVLTSYILHISYNSIQVIALLVDTHGFRQPPSMH